MTTELRPIFLIGMSGAGKSTIGRLLAARVERRFVDLDAQIEAEAGATIRELFASEGEAGFRRRESELLERVAKAGPQIVAVGGGAPCHGDNLERMLTAGLVICLSASPEAIVERIGDAKTRPLLAGAGDLRTELARLLQRRERHYARAPVQIDTTRLAPSQIAATLEEEVARWR